MKQKTADSTEVTPDEKKSWTSNIPCSLARKTRLKSLLTRKAVHERNRRVADTLRKLVILLLDSSCYVLGTEAMFVLFVLLSPQRL